MAVGRSPVQYIQLEFPRIRNMHILDQMSDTSLTKVTLFLTSSEARELRDSVEALLADPAHHHEHVSSSDFGKEITITIYDLQEIGSFDEQSRRMIMEDT